MKSSLFFVAALCLLMIGCAGNDSNTIKSNDVNNPNTAAGNGDMSQLPKFQFVTEEHDFGKLGQGCLLYTSPIPRD